MADLFNLLEELDRPQQQPDIENEHEEDDTDAIIGIPPDDHDNHDNYDHGLAVEASVPPILNVPEVSPAQQQQQQQQHRHDRLDLDALLDQTNESDDAKSLQQMAYQQLKTWWMQEVHAPELMPFQSDLLDSWMQHLQDTEDAEDKTDDTRHSNNKPTSQVALEAILKGIRHVDRQRVKFIVSNLLATRLQKLQKFHLYYSTHTTDTLLSPAEHTFVQDYTQLWKQHMETTTTSHFPQTVWKTLDDPEMIPSPNLDTFCWVRVVDEVTLSPSSWTQTEYEDEDDDELDVYHKGDKLILPYRAAKPLIEQGQMELFC